MIPPSPSRLERTGRFTARHARPVVALWVLGIVLALGTALGGFGNASLFTKLTNGDPNVPGESRAGRDLLATQATSSTQLFLILSGVKPDAAPVAAQVADARRTVSSLPGVLRVVSPYDVPGGPSSRLGRALVSADGTAVLVRVDLRPGLSVKQQRATVALARPALEATARNLPGARAQVGGTTLLISEITSQVESDLRTGEGVALPISLAVMVVVFGGFLAAGMPLAGAIASIAGALLSLYGFASVIELDSTVVNVVTVLGLGLCIDYGLLVVSRFREELRLVAKPHRAEVEAAVGRTVAVAGRTVLFSGLIVAISLCGLLFFQASILRAIGAAGVSVVVVALLVALTFVPALMALAGVRLVRPGSPSRIPLLRRALARFGDVPPPVGVFSRLAQRVQRRPWWVTLGVLTLLAAAALPALSMHLRSSGSDLLPRGAAQRTFFEELDARFPAVSAPDITIVARAPLTLVSQYARSVALVPGVSTVDPPRQQGDLVTLGVRVRGGDPGGQVASSVVHALRAARPSFPTWVTGQAAGTIDYTAGILRRAPFAVGTVVLATFVLLFLMTGSVLVPIKALLMNIVSLGACLGVLVLVFQRGHLEGLLGFTSTGGIESTIPPLTLAFGFGLAMDYEVFLLSRIKEQRDLGASNDRSVVEGLQRSGRIITSAALLVVIVFSGFAAGKLLVVKETGVALVVAVVIDATLVRMLLVPATMTLLGDWNWWAPAPLRRLHQRFALNHHLAATNPP